MPIFYGNIFKPIIHFDKYKNFTSFHPHHEILFLAKKILSSFILSSLYYETIYLFPIPNTKLYIGYAFQTTESVAFPFWELLFLIFR